MKSFKYIVEVIKTLTIVGLVVVTTLPYFQISKLTIDRNNSSTVMIYNEIVRLNPENGVWQNATKGGAGVIINNQYILTVKHLLNTEKDSDGADNLKIVTIDGKKHDAVLYGLPDNKKLDLVILKLKEPLDNAVTPVFQCTKPPIGEEVYTIGAPSGFPRMIQYGNMSMQEIPWPDENERKLDDTYVIHMALFHGNSGGPVFDKATGIVIGLVSAIQYWNDEFGSHPAPVGYIMSPMDMCNLMDNFHISYQK